MGCDRNEKNEVFPFQAWVVSEFPLDNNGKRGFEDPIFQKYWEVNIKYLLFIEIKKSQLNKFNSYWFHF